MTHGWIIGAAFLAFTGAAAYDIYEDQQAKRAAAEKERAERNALVLALSPVTSMLGPSGKHVCVSAAVGANLQITADHCLSSNASSFRSTSQTGDIVKTAEANYVRYGIGSIQTKSEDPEIAKILQDPVYRHVAQDAALVLTDSNIGETTGIFPIVPLDSLAWETTDDPDITKTKIRQLIRWSYESAKPDFLLASPCYAYRKKGISSVIAHDCPTQPGISGAPLGVDTDNGSYGLIAAHSTMEIKVGEKHKDLRQSPLFIAFSKVVKKDEIRFAPTLEAMVSICDRALDNCDVVNDNGRRTLHVTGP
jgi:V8-like Glu-specific endopeptidase